MPDCECIADRFVLTDRRRAIDLATGATVEIIAGDAGSRDEQLQWAGRCDERYLRASMAGDTLIDFGQHGESRRFEAWGASPAWHPERRVEGELAELFESVGERSRVVCVFGPPGAGKSALLVRLARSARLHGFIPFAAHLLASPLSAVIGGRSVFLIDDERAAGVRVLADLALRSTRPHVVIHAATEDARGIPGIRLPFTSRRTPVTVISRAAERAPVYGAASPSPAMNWPVPGDVAELRRLADLGIRHLGEGRHAPGERELRQAIGALMRRGEWASAADASLALAGSLLKRGRPRDAKVIVDAAREPCRRSPGDGRLIGAATVSGSALVDLGRLDEAETVLGAAHTVGVQADDRASLPPVALALARCRFWRGQYADARDAVRLLLDGELDAASRVRSDITRVRLHIGDGDVAGGVSLAARALQRAEAAGRADLTAEASCAAAFAHLAAGDLAALQRDVSACTAASRASRDPLRQLRAQLLLCEGLRRAGRRDDAIKAFARVRRVPARALPRILKCRRDMVADLLAATEGQVSDIVERHIAATGLHALALFVPTAARGQRLRGSPATPVEDAIEVMRACQSAADEPATLMLVCEQVQRQIQAAALGFFGIEPGGLARLVARGPRLDAAAAQRAIDAGVFIPPHQAEGRVEAAMPVRYGGAVIGALGVRWVIGSSPDADRVGVVVAMATAAAAPIVAAALAGRRRGEGPACNELLGASDLMAAMRRSIERAATAPFAVLIDGESGSGKELVARAIHKGGARRDRPFVTLNCAALPDDLVESELFGHARGAFTGAVGERTGVFEEAHTGTLFLDEVGELSPRAQAKVLRVIQEGELRRVGENTSRRVDVRIVSATNRDLRTEASAGRFRLDLLYRLDVVRITVPPLRDRREDIPMLADRIWREAASRSGSQATLGAAVMTALTRYDWQGNVRELQNVLASLVVRMGRRGVVPVSALPPAFSGHVPADSSRLDDARREFDGNFVRAALVRCGGRRSLAAAELGLTRQGLAKLMARLAIPSRAL